MVEPTFSISWCVTPCHCVELNFPSMIFKHFHADKEFEKSLDVMRGAFDLHPSHTTLAGDIFPLIFFLIFFPPGKTWMKFWVIVTSVSWMDFSYFSRHEFSSGDVHWSQGLPRSHCCKNLVNIAFHVFICYCTWISKECSNHPNCIVGTGEALLCCVGLPRWLWAWQFMWHPNDHLSSQEPAQRVCTFSMFPSIFMFSFYKVPSPCHKFYLGLLCLSRCKLPEDFHIDLRTKLTVCLIHCSYWHCAKVSAVNLPRITVFDFHCIAVSLPHNCPVLFQSTVNAILSENPDEVGDLFLDIAEAYMDTGLYLEAKQFMSELVKSSQYSCFVGISFFLFFLSWTSRDLSDPCLLFHSLQYGWNMESVSMPLGIFREQCMHTREWLSCVRITLELESPSQLCSSNWGDQRKLSRPWNTVNFVNHNLPLWNLTHVHI